MPQRKIILATSEIYHVFNRGVEKRPIFTNNREFEQFFQQMRFYQRNRGVRFSYLSEQQREEMIAKKSGALLVEIICYCLMPNHFHFLLKQTTDNGIREFVRKATDSYAKYFNILHDRTGPLFQGNFKAVRIENNNQLLHVSRYIHLNPVTAYLTEEPSEYRWSSYREYAENISRICSKDIVLSQFRSPRAYQRFVIDLADYTKKINRIEHLLLERMSQS